MATWDNTTKNTTVFTNQSLGSQSITFDEATFAWEDAGDATWDKPIRWSNATANTSTFSNAPVH